MTGAATGPARLPRVRADDGTPRHFFSQVQDITARTQAEAALVKGAGGARVSVAPAVPAR